MGTYIHGYAQSGDHKENGTEEGCLSLLGGPRKCKRYKTIKVQYQTPKMQTRTKNFTGRLSSFGARWIIAMEF